MTDQALIEAGRRWREAHDALEALPPDDPREAAQWSVIDEAETAIQTATAATPEGVALQLWVALYHTQTDRETGLASIRHDLAGVLSREQEFDFHARLIVGALRSLSGMTSRLATNRTAALPRMRDVPASALSARGRAASSLTPTQRPTTTDVIPMRECKMGADLQIIRRQPFDGETFAGEVLTAKITLAGMLIADVQELGDGTFKLLAIHDR